MIDALLHPEEEFSVNVRYQQAIDAIFGRLNYERAPEAARSLEDFKLSRMREFLEALGNPQLQVPTVHLTGSKGKGSTATMVARIAEAAGYRVGLFTSPHVSCFEERFTMNGSPPSRKEFVQLWELVEPVVKDFDLRDCGPTYFEIATAMGWLFFAQQKVDLGVIEVGLGGRLDSTNVCSPLVTAITSISKDHQRLLGNTLESIAREKAGIAKPGVPLVTAVRDAEPRQAIEDVARQVAAPVLRLNEEFSADQLPESDFTTEPLCCRFNYRDSQRSLTELQLAMPGEHQVRNAGVAVCITGILNNAGYRISEESIRRGLSTARCPLRIEVISRQPLMIVDAAHNPASIEALCRTLNHVEAEKRIAIFGSSRDKDASVLLGLLNDHFDEIILAKFVKNPRAYSIEELAEFASDVLNIPWRKSLSLSDAIGLAQQKAKTEDLICATGSFFLAAEVKELIHRDSEGNRISSNLNPRDPACQLQPG